MTHITTLGAVDWRSTKHMVHGKGFVVYLDGPPRHGDPSPPPDPRARKVTSFPRYALAGVFLFTLVGASYLMWSVQRESAGVPVAALPQLAAAPATPPSAQPRAAASQAPMCPTRVSYRIGQLDSRFGMDPTAMRSIAADAAEIWNAAIGRPVLTHSVLGSVPINLVYSAAQQRSDDTFNRAQALTAIEEQVQELDDRIAALSAELETDKTSFARNATTWELLGGADAVETRRAGINTRVEEVNTLVRQRNELAARANGVGTITPARDARETVGAYAEEGNSKRIDLYFMENSDQLRWTLAHEMGHALGIDHVADDFTNSGCLMADTDIDDGHPIPTLRLCAADLRALRDLCT